ncbi:MAG: APC family permease [Actinomycetota bacterium]|nr:APC family permease [Actinomycetota bacterium]MDQ3629122.1 APC family permease [Actinomycetota bacterium]
MSQSVQSSPPQEDQPELKRVMGPKLLLLFIVGDILGTGVYALTGDVAAEVGGAAWLPFLVAFAVATVTAFSYLELVTKYPQAAGAALYTHKAFGIHFVTFLVAFAVMCSGITSASTASRAFASNLAAGFGADDVSAGTVTLIAVGFMLLVAAVNFRGVSESVKANVVLTMVELSGLLIVILIGIYAFTGDAVDFSRVVAFDTPDDKNVFLAVTTATSVAFFAMVGFEDSVNMAEETKEPSRIFPKIMLTGLGITGVIYVLVSICAVALVPVGELAASETPLLEVVRAGAPNLPMDEIFPFITVFAVSNSALINMMMASRLLYGMGKQAILPPALSRVHPVRRSPWVAIIVTTVIAVGLITGIGFVSEDATLTLGGTTALLLLSVFAVVNVAVLVLRREDASPDGTSRNDPTGIKPNPDHFRAPTLLPYVGVISCVYLVTPLSGRESAQYEVAGVLLVLGIVLWAVTWFYNRAVRSSRTFVRDPSDLGG